MDNKAQVGKEGESAAEGHLLSKGYVILEKNYRYKRSEIDIIARKDELLVFVEVKARSGHSHGFPEEAVDQAKIDKVMEGADHYIYEKDWHQDIRFDVIAVNAKSGEIHHFEDAFY